MIDTFAFSSLRTDFSSRINCQETTLPHKVGAEEITRVSRTIVEKYGCNLDGRDALASASPFSAVSPADTVSSFCRTVALNPFSYFRRHFFVFGQSLAFRWCLQIPLLAWRLAVDRGIQINCGISIFLPFLSDVYRRTRGRPPLSSSSSSSLIFLPGFYRAKLL